MSHNFKVPAATTGTTYYVSKSGHDSNDGLAPDRPKRTVANYGTGGDTIIIGSGYYKCSSLAQSGRTFIGDGKVILDFDNAGARNTVNGFAVHIDLEIVNANLGNYSTPGDVTQFLRCVLRNCSGGTSTNTVGSRTFYNCLFIDPDNIASGTTGRGVGFNGCIFVGSGSVTLTNSTNAVFMRNCYVAQSVQIVVTSTLVNTFTNNDIQGIIRISGVDYEVKRNRANSTINPTPSLADLATASGWSAVYSQTIFNQDPLFNDVSAGNYTLQANSPLISANSNNVDNIGGYFAQVGIAVRNTDNGNAAGVRVIASPEIDTTIPDAFRLKTTPVNGSVPIAGYVDYIFPSSGLAIAQLKIADLFQFDSDFDSTSGIVYTQNNNVVDSQPEQRSGFNANTTGYAARTKQIGNAANDSTLNIPAGIGAGAVVTGMMVRVNGQVRTISAVSAPDASNNVVVTVSSAFAAAITNGTIVTYGTSSQIAALTPNRLTVLMRTRSSTVPPTIGVDANGYPTYVESEWDNELLGAYGVNGRFFQQEIDQRPGLIIQDLNVWGRGDSDAPTGITPQDLAPRWVHIRVYKRNDYSSNGNPQ